jgi:hypothetical protein
MKVMSAIERCRTAALGGHVARCQNDACGHTHIAYNSCRNRHCPKCQAVASREWMAAREAELLPVAYFHVVFTLPAEVADIAYQNKRVVYDLLFKASSQAMQTIAADPRHLGAKIAITSVLHTWGSAMTHHPHVHMIVPGGGLSKDGERWIACRKGRRPCPPCRRPGVQSLLAAMPPAQVVRLCQAPLRRTEGGPRLSVTIHAPHRHLEPAAASPSRTGGSFVPMGMA